MGKSKGNRRFSLRRAIPYLVAGFLIGGFIRLGYWQLSRADEKEAIMAALSVSADMRPINLDRYQLQSDYQPVVLFGRFDDRQIILENQLVDGRRGVHVYMPFRPEAGEQAVLVNRGWYPAPVGQQLALPELAMPVQIEGMLRSPPRVGVQLGEVTLYPDQWPQHMPYLDMAKLENALKIPLAEQILLSTERSDDSLLRDWKLRSMPPEKHRAYALQWFTMAAAVLILLIVVVRSARRKNSNEPD